MDRPWTYEEWKPSARTYSTWVMPTEKDAKDAISSVSYETKQLRWYPYNAIHWFERSTRLLILGYPELAAGDAFKAETLCDAVLNSRDEMHKKAKGLKGMDAMFKRSFKKKRREGNHTYEAVAERKSLKEKADYIKQESHYILVLALQIAMSFGESLYYCNEGLIAWPQDQRFIDRRIELETEVDFTKPGYISSVQYPWMPERHYRRSVSTLEKASSYMEGISRGKCTIRESIITRSKPEFKKRARFIDADSDFYGVIANKDIRAYSNFMTDITITGVTNVLPDKTCENCSGDLEWPITYTHLACEALWCSQACRDMSINSYHQLTCSKFDWVAEKCSFEQGDWPKHLLLLRFLAASISENKHPLDHETAAMLATRYDPDSAGKFYFSELSSTMRMLDELGIDVYADLRFDTWVLMVLWHKMTSNVRLQQCESRGQLATVHPCATFLNHSCTPNALWTRDCGGTTTRLTAIRDIKKGEEIFVSYLGGGYYPTREERAQQLNHLLKGPCKCQECARAEGCT